MSIENQIERINQNISNTYTELEALGADAPDNKNSDNLVATVKSVKAILYANQDLTEDQKEQARKNIGLDSWQNLNLTAEIVTVGGDSGESVAVTGLNLDLTSYSAKVGDGFYINPVVLPANATNRSVAWQSDKPAVATVNGMGYVECIAEGNAIITCTTVDGGFTATCTVSVAAESGGGDSGEDTGGETTGQKIQLSTLVRTDGGIKSDGTAHTLGNTHYAEVPYSEGMYIRTIWKNGWAAATYPAILVVSGGVYSKPDYSYMTNDDGSLKTDGVATTALGNIAEATLTGFAAGSTVIINMLYPNGSSDSELDATDLLYYIPGGEN